MPCGVALYIKPMKQWIPFLNKPPVVAVVRLQGVIASGARGGLSDRALAPLITKAFSRGKPAAVALEINSPGGSPVQSSLIAGRIRRLSEEKNVPVFAFVEDVAASGGYWLATAADEIHADATSVVGSIGVISANFGAHVLLARQGVERRVYTAGESKSMLDPFKPEKPEDVARLKRLLDQIHQRFITQVRERRGAKLDKEQKLFTGDVWTGDEALGLGLIDGLGHMEPLMKARFGEKVRFRRYGVRKSLASRFGLALMQDAVATMEERAAFARFGL